MTQKMEAGVSIYLANNGFKVIETEVTLRKRWKADIAAVLVPTRTETNNLKLLPPRPRIHYSLFTQNKSGLREKQKKAAAWEKLWDSLPLPLVAMIEIKATKTDLESDRKLKNKKPPCNLAYLAIPKGLIAPPEYPKGYFVIECAKNGTVIKRSGQGQIYEMSDREKIWALHNIAARRHDRTEGAFFRDQQKKWRREDSEKLTVLRMSKAVKIVMGLVTGRHKTVEQALYHHYDGYKAPRYLREELEKVRELAKTSSK